MASTKIDLAGGSALTEIDSARDDLEKILTRYQASETIHNRQEVLESSGENVPSGDILRLTPLNTEARRAFDSVVRLDKDGELEQLHAQYLEVTGRGSLNRTSKHVPNDSDETTDEATSDQAMVNEGFFRVRFRLPAVSERPLWVRTSSMPFPSSVTITTIILRILLGSIHIYIPVLLRPKQFAMTITASHH